MPWHQAITDFWLWVGPTDEPAVNMFSLALSVATYLWIAIPCALVAIFMSSGSRRR
jgi:hypothetical protein